MSKNENLKFDLEELISFGNYVRKNPNTVMRENYINWKKQFKSWNEK